MTSERKEMKLTRREFLQEAGIGLAAISLGSFVGGGGIGPERLDKSSYVTELSKARRVGKVVSSLDLTEESISLPGLSLLGKESRSWWTLKSGGLLVTKATYLGGVRKDLTENGSNVGTAELHAFTREESKVLWLAGPIEYKGENIPLRIAERNAALINWPYTLVDSNSFSGFSEGNSMIIELFPPNPAEGWESYGDLQDAADSFGNSSKEGRLARELALLNIFVPIAFAQGFEENYTSEDIRSGAIRNNKVLPTRGLIRPESGIVQVPFD